MRRWLLSTLLSVLTAVGCAGTASAMPGTALERGASKETALEGAALKGAALKGAAGSPARGPMISAEVEFRISTPEQKRVSGARVIVVAANGKVIATGVTGSDGKWSAKLRVKKDARFAPVQSMGTVTALIVARGYNEEVLFEVPVYSGAVQPVVLRPVQTGVRNEPGAELGNLHRMILMGIVDHYAQLAKLQKQQPIPGEQNYSPWGPGQHP